MTSVTETSLSEDHAVSDDLEFPKRITFQKTFPMEFLDGIQKYVYIEEIGDNDITIITDADLPEGDSFPIKLLYNKDFGELTVFLDRKSHILNRLRRFVLSYDKVSPEAGIILANIASAWQVSLDSKLVSPNANFTVQIFEPSIGDWQCFYMFIIKLSRKGIEYTSDISFPDSEFILRLYLEEEELPIQTIAKFLFAKNISMGNMKGWIEFIDMSEENIDIIERYMEKAIQGHITPVMPEPIELF